MKAHLSTLRTLLVSGAALAATCAQAAVPLMDSTSPGLGTLLVAWWLRLLG